MSTITQLKKALNREWDEGGFFEKLRYEPSIDFIRGEELLNIIKSFDISDEVENIDRDLVRLLWYIPQFMEWQKEILNESHSKDEMKRYLQITNYFNNELERILGTP